MSSSKNSLPVLLLKWQKNDSLMSELGQTIIETENKLNRTDNALVSVQSKIEQQLQRIEFLRTRIMELRQRKESSCRRIEKLQEQKEKLAEDMAQYGAEQTNCEKMLEEKRRHTSQIQKAIQEINTECASLEAFNSCSIRPCSIIE